MLDLHIRKVQKEDIERLDWGSLFWGKPEILSLALNVCFIIAVLAWFREPLDPQVYHTTLVLGALVFVYKNSPHQEAKVAALRQIKDAMIQFVRIENDLYHQAREERNRLAREYNDIQFDIDDSKGLFYRLTSFMRQERILRDTSILEGIALKTSSALGSALSNFGAEHIITTKGFGPVIFVCLPRDTNSASEFLNETEKRVVYGVYIFGHLITRFSAATTLLRLFPQTLESERVVSMRQEVVRLRKMINQKEQELNQAIKIKFGLVLQ